MGWGIVNHFEHRIKLKEQQLKDEEMREKRLRIYNDIGIILWYKVAYDDVLSYKQAKMDEQQEPFRIFQWGENTLIYGPIKALVSKEDREKFCKTANAELRDRGYKNLKVVAYNDAIVVTN